MTTIAIMLCILAAEPSTDEIQQYVEDSTANHATLIREAETQVEKLRDQIKATPQTPSQLVDLKQQLYFAERWLRTVTHRNFCPYDPLPSSLNVRSIGTLEPDIRVHTILDETQLLAERRAEARSGLFVSDQLIHIKTRTRGVKVGDALGMEGEVFYVARQVIVKDGKVFDLWESPTGVRAVSIEPLDPEKLKMKP
jgi:hypothetical protein